MFNKKIYQEAFSSLHASEDVLVEVINMTPKTRKSAKLPRTIALVAAIVSLCGVASAAALFTRYENPAAMLQAFFGDNVDSNDGVVEYDEYGKLMTNIPAWERVPVDETLAEELIAPYISSVGKSTTCGEYVLNVEAMVFDDATDAGMIYYTVENMNGVSGYEVFPDGELFWSAEAPIFTRARSSMGGSRSYVDTAMSSDTKLYICTYFIAVPPAEQVDVGIGLGEDRRKVNDITLCLPSDMGMAGVDLENGAIQLSPVSLRISMDDLGISDAADLDSIVLHYADGSEYVVEDEDDFISNETYAMIDQENHCTCTFNRIVDTNSITAVEINGVRYQ